MDLDVRDWYNLTVLDFVDVMEDCWAFCSSISRSGVDADPDSDVEDDNSNADLDDGYMYLFILLR